MVTALIVFLWKGCSENIINRLLRILGADPLQQMGTQSGGIFNTLAQMPGHALIITEDQIETKTLLPFQQEFYFCPDSFKVLRLVLNL